MKMKLGRTILATLITTATVGYSCTIFADTSIAQRDIAGKQSAIRQSERSSLQSTEREGFPFMIQGSLFYRDGTSVFLNIICYQPLEPGQGITIEIREKRIKDDLRRWRAYQGGTDPIVLHVYPQPTLQFPNRLPKVFYDGVRDLGFWIIRDIYFGSLNLNDGKQKVDAVIAEVNNADALDLIFAWEIGDEFKVGVHGSAEAIESFVEQICDYIKERIAALNVIGVSSWVTWASWPPNDPLYTDGVPVMPQCLDYISYNIYSYDPERIRDHQAGPITGTPYQGYIAALKKCYPTKPLVIIETGLPNSESAVGLDQEQLLPRYPAYRRGGLTQEQIAEGLADRYWDARLLRNEGDPNIVVAGLAIFEWNDEWHKVGNPNNQADDPEEHFGLGGFKKKPSENGYQLRYKLQQETVRDLYTLKFDKDVNLIESVVADDHSLPIRSSTEIQALVSDSATRPVRLRWEAQRGYVIGNPPHGVKDPNYMGEPNSVKFYTGNVALGPATVTVVAIDGNGNVDTESVSVRISAIGEPRIEILTLGKQRASGQIFNVNLDQYKLVCYIQTNQMFVQPYTGMNSIWIGRDGYWWTTVHNDYGGKLICWVVPEHYDPPSILPPNAPSPPGTIASAVAPEIDDNDNDLLPDNWEQRYFGDIERYVRYDDPDGDMGNNLEEFLKHLDPNDPNDDDVDGLWDHWEYHYFGDTNLCDANSDPDGDELTNRQEQNPNLGTHPGRTSQDRDQDGLPDVWEIRWFGNCDPDTHGNPDGDCLDNLDEYELGSDPTISMGDFNCDWIVNLYDLGVFLSAWLSSPAETNWNPACDISELSDSFINFLDLAFLRKNWLLEI